MRGGAHPGGPGEEPGEPPANRMAIAVLALVGIFVCAYLVLHSLGVVGTLVCQVGSCDVVQSSRYAWVGPVPVSAIGLAGYAALFVLGIAGTRPRFARSRAVAGLLLAGAFVGVAVAGYLTYIEAAVLEAWCQWCVISAIVMALIFVAVLPEVPRVRGEG